MYAALSKFARLNLSLYVSLSLANSISSAIFLILDRASIRLRDGYRDFFARFSFH